MELHNNKKYNKCILIVLAFTLLLISAISITRTVYATKPILYLMNDSGVNYTASYFSDNAGAWQTSSNEINPDGSVSAQLIHTKMFHKAIYWVTIGQKMGLFYCTAIIELPAISDDVNIIKHQGNCHFLRTKENKLFMIIDPPSATKNSGYIVHQL